MIDWVSAVIPCRHTRPIHGDSILRVTPEGVQIWETKTAHVIEGSYSDRITLKTHGIDTSTNTPDLLYISGNPVKFFQGHNLFGHNCPHALTVDLMHRLCALVPELQPSAQDWEKIHGGFYEFTRVDINAMFSLGSLSAVNDWISSAEFNARTRHGRPTLKGGTLYFGKHSRRWAIKAYSKAEEVEKGIKQQSGKDCNKRMLPVALRDWMQDKLRIELVLRQKELKEHCNSVAANWINGQTCAHDLYSEYLPRLELNQNMRSENQDLAAKLPSRLLGTYTLWSEGFDLHARMSKPTFYRHRKELLAFGIDITHKPAPRTKSNVVPLVRVLEAKPASIPDWVKNSDLVYTPKFGAR